MKYKNIALKILSMALVACLSFVPMTVLADPTEANVEKAVEEKIELPEDVILLSTAEDVLALAEECVLDTWSVEKTVALNNDIDMSDVEFEGIPTFGGTFLGQGYKITGLYMEHDASVVGFFRYLQKTAKVDNLHIEADILPDGTSKIVGGIVGSKRVMLLHFDSNTFKIILPNMNRATAKESGTGITAQMQKILDYIDENGKITDLEIQDLLGLKKTRAFTLAKQMRDEGLIKVIGRGNEKKYIKA